MANTKKQKGILLLDKNKIDVFVVLAPTVVSFPFQPTVIKNIEVIDQQLLQSQLHTFLTTNKIAPAGFSLILHENILFSKLFPTLKTGGVTLAPAPLPQAPAAPAVKPGVPSPSAAPQQASVPPNPPQPTPPVPPAPAPSAPSRQQGEDEREKAIQRFIDSIPFEEVSVKRTNVPEGTFVAGTNKALITAIRECFEQEGSSIDTIYPMTIFPKDVSFANGLTPELAHTLLAKVDAMKGQNMIADEPKPPSVSPLAQPLAMPQKESEKKRLILLSAVFGVLVIVMIVLFLRMNAENAKLQKKAPPVKKITRPAISPAVSEPVASESAVKENVAIQITGTTADAARVQQLSRQLTENGFTNITVKQGTVKSSKPLVIFSPDIPSAVQTLITGSVASVSAQFAVQESAPSTETTVVITL